MILKVFPKGHASLAYCLGANLENDPRQPTILAGNAAQTQQIINGLAFANPYTSLVLTCDRELSLEEAYRDIADFEATLLPGLDSSAYSRVWIHHTEREKNPITKEILPGGRVRTALHCIIANVHLPTGKRLQPYYDRVDRKRMEAWQELTNYEHGYASPKDPNRRRAFFLSSRLPKSIGELKATLNESVIGAIKTGEITTRENLCEWLKAQGFEIARITKKSISLKHPAHNKNLRMEGELYEHNGVERTIGGIQQEPHRSTGISDDDLARYRRDLAEGLERKRGELFKKFENRVRSSNATLGGASRKISAADSADVNRRGRGDFASGDTGRLMDFEAGATHPESSERLLANDGGRNLGGDEAGHDARHVQRASVFPSSTFQSKINHGNEHKQHDEGNKHTVQPHADRDSPFEFLERIRGRAKQTLQRLGTLIAGFADHIRASASLLRSDAFPIPSIELGGATTQTIGRAFAVEPRRRRELTRHAGEMLHVHDESLRLEIEMQRERKRERPGQMPSL